MCNKANTDDLHSAVESLCEFEPLDKRQVHEAVDENGVVWMFRGGDVIGIRAFIGQQDEALPMVISGRGYAAADQ